MSRNLPRALSPNTALEDDAVRNNSRAPEEPQHPTLSHRAKHVVSYTFKCVLEKRIRCSFNQQ
jgi:hypothetical protein